jgi:hypothetical protein
MTGALPPESLEVSQPELEFDERLAANLVDTGTGVVVSATGLDEAGVA